MKIVDSIFKDDSFTKPTGRSLYGRRIHPITQKEQFHQGVDYSTQGRNLPLHSVENGFIHDIGFNNTVGNYINVAYPRIDIIAIHRHLDAKFVNRGEKVTEGVVIGNVGTTGLSSGEHLHLGLKRISTGEYIDPEKFDYQKHYINGIWDEQFTRDLQTYFGTQVDGVISGQLGSRKNIKKISYGLKGSQLVKAIQRQLGIYPNGQLDSTTIRAIQRRLGVYVDGFISPTSHTVRVMQNRLSEGRLL